MMVDDWKNWLMVDDWKNWLMVDRNLDWIVDGGGDWKNNMAR